MRLLPFVAILVCLLPQAQTAPPRPVHHGRIRVLIQGDDMGAAHGINTATIRAYKEGVLRSTNVIVPGPWFPEAVELLNQNPDLDAGVHLCLTSEWTRLKWRPVTNAPSLVDADGYFFPMVWPNKLFAPNTSLKEAAPKDEEVDRELRRQVEIARQHIPRVSYLSVHMGFTSLKPEWLAIVRKIGKDTGIPLMEGNGINYIGSIWRSGAGSNNDSGPVRAAKLAAKLESLQPGTYLMVDHCGVEDPEMQAMGHPGYEFVAADRAAVTQAWTDPRVMEVVKRRGIELIGHKDLPKLAEK